MRHNLIKILMAPVGFMLAFACVAGATVYGNMQQVTTETVECKIESNDSSLSYCGQNGDLGRKTDYKTFDELVKNESRHWDNPAKTAKIWLKGYDEYVYVVVDQWNDGYSITYFYTQKKGQNFVEAGYLVSPNRVKVKDGVIYVCNDDSMETYLITSNGRELAHKDYIEKESLWGYTNSGYNESSRQKFTGGEKGYQKFMYDYLKASELY